MVVQHTSKYAVIDLKKMVTLKKKSSVIYDMNCTKGPLL